MKIRTRQYAGAVVSNSTTVQYIELVSPDISEFRTYTETDKDKAYEAGTGDEKTYDPFSVLTVYKNTLLWHGLQFHKLSDDAWVMKLQEDKFIADDFNFSVQQPDGDLISTFGTESNQIDLSDSDDFNHTHVQLYREAFCTIKDIENQLGSVHFGNIKIGEVDSDDDINLLSYKYLYGLIHSVWARMVQTLGKRYIIPATIQTGEAEEYLADIAANRCAYEIYLRIKRSAKFGELPDAITRMRSTFRNFEKNIDRLRIPGLRNKVQGAGGMLNTARG